MRNNEKHLFSWSSLALKDIKINTNWVVAAIYPCWLMISSRLHSPDLSSILWLITIHCGNPVLNQPLYFMNHLRSLCLKMGYLKSPKTAIFCEFSSGFRETKPLDCAQHLRTSCAQSLHDCWPFEANKKAMINPILDPISSHSYVILLLYHPIINPTLI